MVLCKCGCGNPAPISKYTDKRRGWIKGEPISFIHGHNKGHNKPHSEEAKKKIRQAQIIWRTTPSYTEFLARMSENAKKSKTLFKKGHKAFTDGKNLIGLQARETHWNWKGGITPEVLRVRHSREYVKWRKAILKRDDYTCQECRERGVYLEVDHYPIRFSVLFKEKNWKVMWDINNGRTLCRPCHDKATWGREKTRSL